MATLLAITVLLPLIGSVVLILMPKLDKHQARNVALGFVLATFGLSLLFLLGFNPGETRPQFAFGPAEGPYGLGWMSRPDIRFALGLDGLSFWLFLLTTLLMITAVFASWESISDRAPLYYAFLLALETGLLGLFASLDVVLFYIFFEFTLIPLFFLIGLWGGPERQRASVTFFLYTLAGSLLTLLGVIALVVVHHRYAPGHVLTFSIPELTRGLAAVTWPGWHETGSWTSPQVLIFLLLLAGFAIKVPMFPFHTWLPLAHVEAPTAGSIILAGVLLKVGSYGLMRFNMGMVPLGAVALFPLLSTLAVIGIIYGALVALAQTDIKRLVAYSSVSHMGFIVLGMFALNGTGMDGVGDPDGQPRADDRRALRLRGGALRALPHARDERGRRPLEPAADPCLLLHPRRAWLGGRAGAQRIRGRVPDPGRDVRREPAGRGARRHGHDPGRRLPALDAPESRLRPAPRAFVRWARSRTRGDSPGGLVRDRRAGAADGPDRPDRHCSRVRS